MNWEKRIGRWSLQKLPSALSNHELVYKDLTNFVRFGPSADEIEPNWKAPSIPLPFVEKLNNFSGGLALEVWFKCLPSPKEGSAPGGIIIGSQSAPIETKAKWPQHHWQIFFVDTEGTLRAGFDAADHAHIQGLKVNDGKWHQAILSANKKSQYLYVDGRLCGTSNMNQVKNLPFLQIGTGVISGGAAGKPTTDFADAYPFNGIVHDVRLFERFLGSGDVLRLFDQRLHNQSEPLSFVNSALVVCPQFVANASPRITSLLIHEDDAEEVAVDDLKELKLAQPNSKTVLLRLPYEISAFRILAMCSYKDILNLAATCQEYKSFVTTIPDEFWQTRCSPLHVHPSEVSSLVPWIHRYGFLSRLAKFGPHMKPTDDRYLTYHQPVDDFDYASSLPNATVEAWIKCFKPIEAKGIAAYQGGIIFGTQSGTIAGHEEGSWPHYHWQPLLVGIDGRAMGSFDCDFHNHMVGPEVTDGEWHHLLLTSNPTGQKLFVDGVTVGTIEYAGDLDHHRFQRNAQIGSGIISGNTYGVPGNAWADSFPFHGLIRDFKFTKKAFTDQEAKAAYNLHRYVGPDVKPSSTMTPNTRPPNRQINRPGGPFFRPMPVFPTPMMMRPQLRLVDDDIEEFTDKVVEKPDAVQVVQGLPLDPSKGLGEGLNRMTDPADVIYFPLCGKARDFADRAVWVYERLPMEKLEML
ncbi:hypothetical protein HDU97_009365 [Phlyctochytrium planicorne]|nr:hypothetical protein HDU97_009365 [Phlyctochytrium planicorne]